MRLHFFAFSSAINLFKAVSDVSTSDQFVLMHNFNVQNSRQSPVIKDSFLSITPGKYSVYFRPQESSFAFASAIEGIVSKYTAPDSVYQTAQQMNINTSWLSNKFNITWCFNALKQKQRVRQNAYLDGLEIMEIIEKAGSVPVVNGPKKKHFMAVVGSVLACSVLICILEIVLSFVLIWRKQKPDEFPLAMDWSLLHVHEGGGSHGGFPEGTGFPVHNVNLGVKIPYVEIKFATHNFDRKLVMGKGAFGNVYRGTLRNSMKVAVKRGETGSGQGLPEFQTAIIVL
ncbi:hypothetical protein WN944_021304 [Citrus x changshan-huyou]|uniref:Uncharacterized protein n=1 Tax=Citrus x changshan-huyou TaxID=2935761 RepID=A0AAP0N2U9_9ROSI